MLNQVLKHAFSSELPPSFSAPRISQLPILSVLLRSLKYSISLPFPYLKVVLSVWRLKLISFPPLQSIFPLPPFFFLTLSSPLFHLISEKPLLPPLFVRDTASLLLLRLFIARFAPCRAPPSCFLSFPPPDGFPFLFSGKFPFFRVFQALRISPLPLY